MQRLTLVTSLSFGLGASLCASAAFAQDDCNTDADCEAGFVCGVVGSSGCAGAACPENDPDCKVEPVDCAPEEFHGCVPAPCETDADCGADMVCETYEWGACSGSPPCDADGNCEPAPEPACETGTTSQCVYKWETSCEVDADCGEGFTCEQEEAGCDCASSGGRSDPAVPEEAGEGGSAGFAPPAEDPPEGELPLPPEEEPTGCDCGEPEIYTYCAAEEITCESNDDCPSSWTCETIYERDCGDVAVDGEDSTDSAERPAIDVAPIPPADDDGEPPPDESDPLPAMDGGVATSPEPQPCEPVVTAQMCVPPGRVGVDEGGVATGADGDGEGVPLEDDPDVEDDVAEEPPTDDAADDDVGSADDDATDDEDETDDNEADDDTDDGDDDVADDEADDDDGSETSGVNDDGGDDGSCSVAQTGSSGGNGAWAALLLGLPLILRRRRNK